MAGEYTGIRMPNDGIKRDCICNDLAGVKCGSHYREERQQIQEKQWAEQALNSAYQRARAQSQGLLTNVTVPGYEEKYIAPSGATSGSKAPDYTLCPPELEEAAVERFHFGVTQPNGHAKDNWKKGKDDAVFVKERMNHLKRHLTTVMAGNGSWADFEAVVCNAAMICWWRTHGTGLREAFPNLAAPEATSGALGLGGGVRIETDTGYRTPAAESFRNAGSPAVGRPSGLGSGGDQAGEVDLDIPF